MLLFNLIYSNLTAVDNVVTEENAVHALIVRTDDGKCAVG